MKPEALDAVELIGDLQVGAEVELHVSGESSTFQVAHINKYRNGTIMITLKQERV